MILKKVYIYIRKISKDSLFFLANASKNEHLFNCFSFRTHGLFKLFDISYEFYTI